MAPNLGARTRSRSPKGGIQIFVKGLTDKTRTISVPNDEYETMTVRQFKQKVEDQEGFPPEEQRLIFGAKQLSDDDAKMKECGVKDLSTVFLLLRLLGGGPLELSEEPCMICLDGEAYKMPGCGCPMSAIGLSSYLKSIVTSGRHQICCPNPKHRNQEWSYWTLRDLNLLSTEEREFVESKVSENFAMQRMGAQQCPSCQTFCIWDDDKHHCVRCRQCRYEFCWLCLHKWNGRGTTHCNCTECGGVCGPDLPKLRILAAAPPTANPIRYCNATGVPSQRACPVCGTLIEHAGECKRMHCPQCKTNYCHICLKTEAEHQNGEWSFSFKCKTAPVQTSIPKKD